MLFCSTCTYFLVMKMNEIFEYTKKSISIFVIRKGGEVRVFVICMFTFHYIMYEYDYEYSIE